MFGPVKFIMLFIHIDVEVNIFYRDTSCYKQGLVVEGSVDIGLGHIAWDKETVGIIAFFGADLEVDFLLGV